MRIRDRRIEIVHDYIPGHEYEVMVQAVDITGRIQEEEDSPKNSIVIRGKESGPGAMTAMIAFGGINLIIMFWTNPADYDFDVAEIWRATSDNIDRAEKVAEVRSGTYADQLGAGGLTRYYWVRAKNTSGVVGDFFPSGGGRFATSLFVTATAIADFSIDATKRLDNTIVLQGDSWTDNSPAAGHIAWNEHYLIYGGYYYKVDAGSTDKRYIYWDIGETGGSGTVADPFETSYTALDTYASVGASRFVVATNASGSYQLVWNSSANMVIGNAFIVDLLADKITAGTITGSTIRTAASGQRAIMDSSDNTIRILNNAGTTLIKLDDNVFGPVPGIELFPTGGIISVVTSDDAAVILYAFGTTGRINVRTKTATPAAAFTRTMVSPGTASIVEIRKLDTAETGYYLACRQWNGAAYVSQAGIQDNGEIWTSDVVNAVGGYEDNGTPGIDLGPVDPNTLSSVTFSGGLLTAAS